VLPRCGSVSSNNTRNPLRHAVEFGGLLVPGEGDAALGLDLGEPERAVRAGAGKDNADSRRVLVFRQRLEEVVDGYRCPWVPPSIRPAMVRFEPFQRREQLNGIGRATRFAMSYTHIVI
jgi:hypothetical protein